MIAVARSAGRSAQVSTDNERVIVDALVILGELVGILYPLMWLASAWQRAHVFAMFIGLTVECESLGILRSWTL